jgi:tetratricopeptide (TPR) repeat protein
MTLNNFAVFFKSQGNYDQAEALYRRALSIFRKALGPKHPKVTTCRLNYASLLRVMNRPADTKKPSAILRRRPNAFSPTRGGSEPSSAANYQH